LQDAQSPDISFETAANRSYYCIFNAMRAVLSLDRFDSKKHSGIIDAFRSDPPSRVPAGRSGRSVPINKFDFRCPQELYLSIVGFMFGFTIKI
jgi:hypothetical protein